MKWILSTLFLMWASTIASQYAGGGTGYINPGSTTGFTNGSIAFKAIIIPGVSTNIVAVPYQP